MLPNLSFRKWTTAIVLLAGTAVAQEQPPAQSSAQISLPEEVRLEYAQTPAAEIDAPSATREQELSADEKFRVFMQEALAGDNFVRVSAEARTDSFANIGATDNAELIRYRRRYAYAMAQRETTVFLEKFLLPVLFKQDPRYHQSEKNGFANRFSYAMTRVLVTRRDTGGHTFNSSKVLATFMSEAAASTYRPDRDPFYYSRRSATDALSRAGVSLATDAGVNVLREFWPDVKKKLLFWRD